MLIIIFLIFILEREKKMEYKYSEEDNLCEDCQENKPTHYFGGYVICKECYDKYEK